MTVSDLFDLPVEAPKPSTAEGTARDTRPRVRARVATAESDGKVPAWPVRIKDRVVADWHDAWLWDATGLTLGGLWAHRIPARESVPAENRGLWTAWIAYNHAALLLLVPLLFAAWVLGHPARLINLTPIAAAITAIWLL